MGEKKSDRTTVMLIAAVLGYLVPGAGYLPLKDYRRAGITFISITFLAVAGLYIGSIGVIDPVNAKPWYAAQVLISPVVVFIARLTAGGEYPSYGRACDVGQIYTCVAGLLNLLVILNAVYLAHSGRGEMIGEDEDE